MHPARLLLVLALAAGAALAQAPLLTYGTDAGDHMLPEGDGQVFELELEGGMVFTVGGVEYSQVHLSINGWIEGPGDDWWWVAPYYTLWKTSATGTHDDGANEIYYGRKTNETDLDAIRLYFAEAGMPLDPSVTIEAWAATWDRVHASPARYNQLENTMQIVLVTLSDGGSYAMAIFGTLTWPNDGAYLAEMSFAVGEFEYVAPFSDTTEMLTKPLTDGSFEGNGWLVTLAEGPALIVPDDYCDASDLLLDPHSILYPPYVGAQPLPDGDISFTVVLPLVNGTRTTLQPFFIGDVDPLGVTFESEPFVTPMWPMTACGIAWVEAIPIKDLLPKAKLVKVTSEGTIFEVRLVVEWNETCDYCEFPWTRNVQSPTSVYITLPRFVDANNSVTVADSTVVWAYTEKTFVLVDDAGLVTVDLQIRTMVWDSDYRIDPATFLISGWAGAVGAVSEPVLLNAGSGEPTDLWLVTVNSSEALCSFGEEDNFTIGYDLELKEATEQRAAFELGFHLVKMENWCAIQFDLPDLDVNLDLYASDKWIHKTNKALPDSMIYANVHAKEQLSMVWRIEELLHVLVQLQSGEEFYILWNHTITEDGDFLEFEWVAACVDVDLDACFAFRLNKDNFTVGERVTLVATVNVAPVAKRGAQAEERTIKRTFVVAPASAAQKEAGAKGQEGQVVVISKVASSGTIAALVVFGCLPFVALIVALVVVKRRAN